MGGINRININPKFKYKKTAKAIENNKAKKYSFFINFSVY